MLDFLTDLPYKIIDVFDFKVSDTFRGSSYRNKAENSIKGAMNGTYITGDAKKIRDPGKDKQIFKGTSFLLTSHTTNSAGVVTAAIQSPKNSLIPSWNSIFQLQYMPYPEIIQTVVLSRI
jgi:hypothetical protein